MSQFFGRSMQGVWLHRDSRCRIWPNNSPNDRFSARMVRMGKRRPVESPLPGDDLFSFRTCSGTGDWACKVHQAGERMVAGKQVKCQEINDMQEARLTE